MRDADLRNAYRSLEAPADAAARALRAFENRSKRRITGIPLVPVGMAAAILVAAALWPGGSSPGDDATRLLGPPVREFTIPAMSSLRAGPRPSFDLSLPVQPSLSVVSPVSMTLISQSHDEV
jgi:hypothetical protein